MVTVSAVSAGSLPSSRATTLNGRMMVRPATATCGVTDFFNWNDAGNSPRSARRRAVGPSSDSPAKSASVTCGAMSSDVTGMAAYAEGTSGDISRRTVPARRTSSQRTRSDAWVMKSTPAAPRFAAATNGVSAPMTTRPTCGTSIPFGSTRGPCATTSLPRTSTPA